MLLDLLLPTGGRKSRKLIANGERAEATVAGIRVTELADSPVRWEYALDVHAPTGTFRVGCRQALSGPAHRAATIGRRIPVRHDRTHASIDEAAMMGSGAGAAAATGNTGWKSIDPPDPGVVDARLRRTHRKLQDLTSIRAVLVTVESKESEERWRLTVLAGDSDLPVAATHKVPHYAASRVVPGAELPARLKDDGTVLIDWVAVTEMPESTGRAVAPVATVASEPAVGRVEMVAPKPAPQPTSSSISVPYEFRDKADAKEFQAWLKLRVMQSHGVPAARLAKAMAKSDIAVADWSSVDSTWIQRCQSNPALAEQLRLAGG